MLRRFHGRPETVARFLDLARRGALGHSYLFCGPEGSGKEATALEIARLVNCASPGACADGAACESCQKAVSFQHPDIRWIGPAPAAAGENEAARLFAAKQEDPFHQPAWAASGEVLIGDPERPGPLTIRSLLQALRLKPFQGTTKVAVVADAHRLRAGAANAFLKMLEEPPAGALIILLSTGRAGMLPTILSRCQQISFRPYRTDELGALLRTVYGLDEADASRLAALGGGNARRAARLRLPEPRVLLAWARSLVAALHEGRPAAAMNAAESLHKGVLPAELVDAVNEGVPRGEQLRNGPVKELVQKRERAMLLCDDLHLYYADVLGAAQRGEGWEPVVAQDRDLIRSLAARRDAAGLLADVHAVEAARRDVERNLNIGLVMTMLFQELHRHARAEETRV